MGNTVGSVCVLCLTLSFAGPARAAAYFEDHFDSVARGASAWVTVNNSDPAGAGGWQRGPYSTLLQSRDGDDAFMAASYEAAGAHTAAAPIATTSAWLISPALTFHNNDEVSFTTSAFINQDYPDRVQFRVNLTNTGTDVGTTATSVGDFTRLLLDLNPTYAATGEAGTYPTAWTTYTATLSGLTGPTPGRLAWRYFVEDSGPEGTRGNEIGLDDVTATEAAAVPEPRLAAPLAMAAAGLLAGWRRRRPRHDSEARLPAAGGDR